VAQVRHPRRRTKTRCSTLDAVNLIRDIGLQDICIIAAPLIKLGFFDADF